MLHLHFANRLETLLALLMAHASATPRAVFEPLQVLVPSLGMRRHLMLALAAHDGICANVRFEFLAQWLWAQPQRSGADVPASPPLAPARLAWRVLAAFDDAAFTAPHPRLASWLGAADPVMRLELAQRSATLIEQYATYRADGLARWTAGQWAQGAAPLSADEAWQAALWRRLSAERAVADPVQVLADLLAAHPAAVPGLPAAIHVFALPTMPPLHLQLLQGWAGRTEVHVYALNPCREYWFDPGPRRRGAPLAEGTHPLLAGWGTQTRQQLEQLVAAMGDGAFDDGHYVPHGEPTWLGRLHDSLLDSEMPAPGSWAAGHDNVADRSIELHVCHSLTRQIEVLHDRLLGLFAADPALRADAVLVVVPDLEKAAPLVDAVFGSAPPARALPYTVTGRPGSQVNGVARAFVALLGLAGSRLLAGEVYALLQQPPVARRFGLDSAALDLLRSAIDQSGVRWGLDAPHRGSLGLPATTLNTWADGLQRLLLGHLVADGETPEPFAGVLPAAGLEGSAAACLGGLHGFVRALAALHESLAQPLPGAAWREHLAACIDTFIDPAGDERDELRALHAALHDTCTAMADGGPALRLPLAVVLAALVQRLDDPAHGGVPGGAITFSSMSSLRGLPYAWVCVLGLDDDSFPSKAQPDEFDLIALAPRAGDRQRRSDERALFLDLLLAARNGVHLSHTGRSIRDNALLPPSVLVAELIDFLAAAAGDQRARWIVEHPLQPFSAAAFSVDGDPRIRSHHAEMAAALSHSAPAAAQTTAFVVAASAGEAGSGNHEAPEAADDGSDAAEAGDADDSDTPARFEPPPPRFFETPLPAPAEADRHIDLPRLIGFFAHPARALLRGRLGLEWAQDRPDLEDTEPLLPDHRARRALAERLLQPLLLNSPAQGVQALAEAGNDWPDGSIGRPALAVLLHDLGDFAAALRPQLQAPVLPPGSVALAQDIDGLPWSLHATLADVRASGLLRWRFEPLDGRGLLAAWIEHLVLCLAVEQGLVTAQPHTALHRLNGRWALRAVADPATHLSALMHLYAQGQREPLPLPARATWAFVQKLREQKTEAAGLTAARNAWRGTPSPPIRGEAEDPAWRLALRGVPEPIDAAFAATATAVFAPILDHLDEPD